MVLLASDSNMLDGTYINTKQQASIEVAILPPMSGEITEVSIYVSFWCHLTVSENDSQWNLTTVPLQVPSQ